VQQSKSNTIVTFTKWQRPIVLDRTVVSTNPQEILSGATITLATPHTIPEWDTTNMAAHRCRDNLAITMMEKTDKVSIRKEIGLSGDLLDEIVTTVI
jgi:hypothetical protein